MEMMPPRKMDFGFDDDIDMMCVADRPEISYFLLGVSLILPMIEPYVVKVAIKALSCIGDKRLIDNLKSFIGQEAQHARQHALLNNYIKKKFSDRVGIEKIEKQLKADYDRFLKHGSLKFNIAYVEGFETFVRTWMKFVVDKYIFEDMKKGSILDLYTWHAIEEIEHRVVTYETFKHLYNGNYYRITTGIYSNLHSCKYVVKFCSVLLRSDRETYDSLGGLMGRVKRLEFERQRWKGLLTEVARAYRKSYDPADMKLTEGHSFYNDKVINMKKADEDEVLLDKSS